MDIREKFKDDNVISAISKASPSNNTGSSPKTILKNSTVPKLTTGKEVSFCLDSSDLSSGNHCTMLKRAALFVSYTYAFY